MSVVNQATTVRQYEGEYVGHHARTVTSTDGLKLSINLWSSKSPKATLMYIHGIQSHSGWLFETAPYLAGKGINVVAMDRRGSGASEGIRGHSDTADKILSDYRQAWEYASHLAEDLPFVVLGQSFGGSVLAGLVCRYNLQADKLIFSAPALGQQRLRHGPYELNRRRAAKGTEHVLIGLRDAEYSTDEKYLRFIANDALINRSITVSMASSLVELEDIYFDNKICLENIAAQVHFIEPRFDSIINMNESRSVLEKYIPIKRHLIDTLSHYMEFSNKRYELWKTIVDICNAPGQVRG